MSRSSTSTASWSISARAGTRSALRCWTARPTWWCACWASKSWPWRCTNSRTRWMPCSRPSPTCGASLVRKKLRTVPLYGGGTATGWEYWVPGKGIALQEDFGQMVSPVQFREMIFKHDRPLAEGLDCLWFHVHSGAMHMAREIARDLAPSGVFGAVQITNDYPAGPSIDEMLPTLAVHPGARLPDLAQVYAGSVGSRDRAPVAQGVGDRHPVLRFHGDGRHPDHVYVARGSGRGAAVGGGASSRLSMGWAGEVKG